MLAVVLVGWVVVVVLVDVEVVVDVEVEVLVDDVLDVVVVVGPELTLSTTTEPLRAWVAATRRLREHEPLAERVVRLVLWSTG